MIPEDNKWTPLGWDIVRFEAAANPGQDLAIEKQHQAVSWREFLLALKSHVGTHQKRQRH